MARISNLSGSAGSSYAPLRPTSTAPTRHPHGPFTAELSPSLPVRATGAYPPGLFLGLLITQPDPDGVGGKELDHPGYERQPVELAARGSLHWVVNRPVLFDIFGCPPVTALALFDAEGQVAAHGKLRGRGTQNYPPSRFEFASHQIVARRVWGAHNPMDHFPSGDGQ